MIDKEHATQIGFLLKTFDEELVGTGKELPVDVAGEFAGVVKPMFGELDRKPVKGTLVETGDEAFDNLLGEEIE